MAGPTLTLADAQAIVEEGGPAIASVASARSIRAKVVAGDKSWVPAYIRGVTERFLETHDWKLSSGRLWSKKEEAENTPVCVIGSSVAKELFGAESPVGKSILINELSLKVVGTLMRRMPTNAVGLDQDDIVLAPFGIIKERFKKDGAKSSPTNGRNVGSVYVRVKDERQIPVTIQKVASILRKRHGIEPGQADDFEIRHLGEVAKIPSP